MWEKRHKCVCVCKINQCSLETPRKKQEKKKTKTKTKTLKRSLIEKGQKAFKRFTTILIWNKTNNGVKLHSKKEKKNIYCSFVFLKEKKFQKYYKITKLKEL